MKTRKKKGSANEFAGPVKSVKGLANIGALVLPVAAAHVPPPGPKHNTSEAIVDKTVRALLPHSKITAEPLYKIINAAVREALVLGHSMGVGQNDAVEKMLEQRYEATTELTMPAVVAAVMEHTGMNELMLDLNTVASVFSRCRIEQDMLDGDDHNAIIYKLRYLADDNEGAGDNSFSLAP